MLLLTDPVRDRSSACYRILELAFRMLMTEVDATKDSFLSSSTSVCTASGIRACRLRHRSSVRLKNVVPLMQIEAGTVRAKAIVSSSQRTRLSLQRYTTASVSAFPRHESDETWSKSVKQASRSCFHQVWRGRRELEIRRRVLASRVLLDGHFHPSCLRSGIIDARIPVQNLHTIDH